ncbi:cellulase family glycosylhydrolase [Planctomycetota bacterium]|nr:cellulase family glycosylhydrolase [Planctomycetota bacterium]
MLEKLRVKGKYLVDKRGEMVALKGCNLGNWFLIEPWMFGASREGINDHYGFWKKLEDRFGVEKVDALKEAHYENWITERDFAEIKRFGFNVVRVPFHYERLESDSRDGTIRAGGFKWLDKAVDMAENAEIYVILDMHAVPGGQSIDAPSGRIGENNLWTDEQAQMRAAKLWKAIAKRYGHRGVIAAYDVMNEPWDNFSRDNREDLVKIVGKIHDAIREVDETTLVYAPGSLRGVEFYGKPAERGWKNVGYTEHHYPGLFGNGDPTLDMHARNLAYGFMGIDEMLEDKQVPYLVGEFNAVFDLGGNSGLMRHYYDAYGERGWQATMWSYKLVKEGAGIEGDGWYMVSNAEPLPWPDFETASYDTFYELLSAWSQAPLAVDEELIERLTEAEPIDLKLKKYEIRRTAPEQKYGDWKVADIGGAIKGGVELIGENGFALYGGGSDIWTNRDSFRYLYKRPGKQFEYHAVIESFEETNRYAKTGLMLRANGGEDSAMLMLNVFPNGEVMVARRDKDGADATEKKLTIDSFPTGLYMKRAGDQVVIGYTDARGEWQYEKVDLPEGFESDNEMFGVVALSHVKGLLTKAVYQKLEEGKAKADIPKKFASGPNLLINDSFEIAKNDIDKDQAKEWNRWGDWFNRSKIDDQYSLVFYHNRRNDGGTSGIWQDVSGLEAGEEYEFSVLAKGVGVKGAEGFLKAVELHLENVYEGKKSRVIKKLNVPVEAITADESGVRISVRGVPEVEKMRVLIVVSPSNEDGRVGQMVFDQAALRKVQN